MAKTIYKCTLTSGQTVVRMNGNAKILSVQSQHDAICIWCEVELDNEQEDRTFMVYPTGIPIASIFPEKFLGTVMINDGTLVFHVYERLTE